MLDARRLRLSGLGVVKHIRPQGRQANPASWLSGRQEQHRDIGVFERLAPLAHTRAAQHTRTPQHPAHASVNTGVARLIRHAIAGPLAALSLTPIHSLRHRLVRSRQYASVVVLGFLRF